MRQYKNDTREIDVELLSYQDTGSSPTSPANFVLHADGPAGKAVSQLPFHPSDGYHEYRFDWSPGKVSFYADGGYIKDLTEGIPTDPGSILLNHWSNGDPNWSKGPPTADVIMTVAYVKAYFNKPSEGIRARGQCVDSNAKDAVCQIPDQLGPISPGQDTVFLTEGDGNYLPTQPLRTTVIPPVASSTDLAASGATNSTVANQMSADATCGGTNGYTCLGSEKGNCCSSHGWW